MKLIIGLNFLLVVVLNVVFQPSLKDYFVCWTLFQILIAFCLGVLFGQVKDKYY